MLIPAHKLSKECAKVYPNGVDPHRGYPVSKDGIRFEGFTDGEIEVDKLLEVADLKLEWYIPSLECVEFFMFIRLVLGEEPENNNPPAHYFFIDTILKNPNVEPFYLVRGIDIWSYSDESVVLASREFSKSVLITYLILFMAYKGRLKRYGKINYGLYVSDSMRNNVKKMMNRLKGIFYESEFLQDKFEEASFTQEEMTLVRHPQTKKDRALFDEYVNKRGRKPYQVPGRMKRTFKIDGLGAQSLPLDTKLFTENGFTTIGECKVGDKIVGADGKLATITDKSIIFNKDMYRINLEDGRSLDVSIDHINSVMIKHDYKGGRPKYKEVNITTKELLEKSLYWSRIKRRGDTTYPTKEKLIWIKNCEPIEYKTKDLAVDPYTLGLLIGDGSTGNKYGSASLHMMKSDIYEIIDKIPYKTTRFRIDKRSKAELMTIGINGIGKNIVSLGANVTCLNKFIPKEYLRGDIEQRLSLLRGLIDTDGSISKTGRMRYYSTSKQLILDVVDLIRSLGGTVFTRLVERNELNNKHSDLKIIEFSLEFSASTLSRKKNRQKATLRQRDHKVAIISIEKIPTVKSQCIAVDNNEHQFIANSYFRTHNTSSRGASNVLTRPQFVFCHKKGTTVETDIGTCLVEDYYNRSESRFDIGRTIKLHGLDKTETVTNEHRYWTKKQYRIKYDPVEYKETGRNIGKTVICEADWCEAKDLTNEYWIGTPIDYSVCDVEPIHYKKRNIISRDEKGRVVEHKYSDDTYIPQYFNDPEWWWVYGLWLGDGHRGSKYTIGWTIADTQKNTIGKKLEEFLVKYDFKMYKTKKQGCYQLNTNSVNLSQWLKKYKRGNSTKDIPEWILKISTDFQKQILLGYIAADGYVSKDTNQIRINSINRHVLMQLQKICNRLGLPSHIRTTKRAGEHKFPNGIICKNNKQWEIRLSDNVQKVLGIDIGKRRGKNIAHLRNVSISDGMLWRRVETVEVSEESEFIPIHTPTHTYTSEFGLSHNCDDMVANEVDAASKPILEGIESTIESDIRGGLSGSGYFMVVIGTPYNKNDPVYRRVEEGLMIPIVFPRALCMPTDDVREKDFESVWPDRHSYKKCRMEYRNAKKAADNGNGYKMKKLSQEHYLVIAGKEDRLVQDDEIQWYNRTVIEKNLGGFNLYGTTDFTASNTLTGDLSGSCLWALNSNGDWFMLDLSLKAMGIEEQYEPLFNMVQIYQAMTSRTIEVGVETNGQQQINIPMLKKLMREKNIYFTIARQVGKPYGSEGISRQGGGDKHQHFMRFHPLMQRKKIFFPEELKDTLDMKELLSELSYVSNTSINSKKDDGIDLMSMLPLVETVKPAANVDRAIMSRARPNQVRRDEPDAGAGY